MGRAAQLESAAQFGRASRCQGCSGGKERGEKEGKEEKRRKTPKPNPPPQKKKGGGKREIREKIYRK